ncbi:MAG TPA: capsule assembly Wzi family protein [Terriglobales bacterium]|nr:capsule assembly Wzi family protein [Terriglobales bacterium]
MRGGCAGALLAVVIMAAHPATSQQTGSAAADSGSQPRAPANVPAMAQNDGSYGLLPGEQPDNHLGFNFLNHLAMDQKNFWVAPAHLKIKDLRWMLPLAGGTAALIASDSWMSKQVPDSPGQIDRSRKLSDYGAYSLIGLDGASFVLGELRGNDHLGETGLLGGEAALNASAAAYVLKAITQRPRPEQGNQHGSFLQGGASFPSEHSAIAWSVASVWAHEYPGTFSQIMAYGLASAVSLTRVTGREHFPSDVVIGGALGWYFGREAYRAHHDPELGGAPWGPLLPEPSREQPRRPEDMGSPDVPLDSWVYPALERLQALGYIHSAYLGLRPWTRMECARLVEEAGERLPQDDQGDGQGDGIVNQLAGEFAPESAWLEGSANLDAAVDSVYSRATSISGSPLRDGYHFAQTIINDYGRPYGEGFNNITGITAHAVAGPLFVSIQAEYQHAPAVASEPASVLAATAAQDQTEPLADGRKEIGRLRLLASSAGFVVHNTQVSFGLQSLWLGPGESGPLLMSDNAEPFLMLRIASASPAPLPLLSRLFGPAQTEFFVGQLSGHHWELNFPTLAGPNLTPQPFIQGEKISFKPTPNLEFGMGITAMFGGPGLPFTWRNFLRTYYAHSSNAQSNPGKRTSTADFSYRIPGLRNWLTLYMDSMVVDEISPLGSTRATVNPGVYLPRVPRVPRLEIRAEGLHEPLTQEFGPGFVYIDYRRFRDGYTNNGNLMGSWIGRAGLGGQAWLTYHLAPRSQLQFVYRHQEAARSFIGGGRLNDYSAGVQAGLSAGLVFSGSLQYEQWKFPVLSPLGQTDVSAAVQLTFTPHWRAR